MPTVKIVILKHQKKDDDTWNVKIRITHERKSSYIATSHYVGMDLINKKTFELKERNNPIYDLVMTDVLRIREEISKLGHTVDLYSAKGLSELIKEKLSNKPNGINFFDFGYAYADKIIKEGRRVGENYRIAVHKFEEFIGGRNILFSDITSSLLMKYDEYLRGQRSKCGIGNISDSGVRLYMSKIQAIFNQAKLTYNDEETGIIRIQNNPFVKYKIPKIPMTRKKSLSVEQIRSIKSCRIPDNMTGVLVARDVFVMSFLMAGMNTVDMYYLGEAVDGRLEYERRKTRTRRADKAFISIKIEPELLPYIERYKDSLGDRAFNFFVRYATHKQFVHKVNTHLKTIGSILEIPDLTFYAARHSWATIARNECGISMDDVSMCLNHKSGHDVTDTYIRKDWSVIDRANRKVLDYVFGDSISNTSSINSDL
ncbi:site-specific integrase [Bacteroides finegoldii]|uniref:tyrosine-type recombinase/integrase n=1 Tax=Bacteroides finegoldii TaxID=338188 RepID=UPI00265D4A5E|nr:site-specific integrase [Bacteroides finegoldii]